MQRKSAYPSTTSNIKLVDYGHTDEDDVEQQQRRQQLINFGHATWGFNNWNWTVTKQELDFVDFANGKYCAGVVAYVSISIKSFDIHRENIGYATAFATSKGFAIYKCRKNAVTNALRETLLSFGGNVACELEAMEAREQAEEHNGPAPAPALGPGPPHGPAPPPHVPAPPPHVPAPSPHGPAPLPHVPAPPPHVPAPSPHVPIVPHAAAPPALASAPPPAPVSAPAPAPISTPAPMKQELKPLCAPRMENGRAAAAPVAKAHPMPASMPRGVPPLRPNSNEPVPFVDPSEEERAERKRRQRQAQEEFRQRQLLKYQAGLDERPAHQSSSFDKLRLAVPSQDIEIQETGEAPPDTAKRKSPTEHAAKRRASVINKLDIVVAD